MRSSLVDYKHEAACRTDSGHMEAPPNPWAHLYYKAVATVGSRYFSIFDGSTEYVQGVRISQEVHPRHGGGFYVFRTMEEALCVDVPAASKLRVGCLPCPLCACTKQTCFGCAQSVQISLAILVQECPRAVVKLWGWGDLCVYDSGKLAERALSVLSSVAVLWCAYVLAVFTRPLPS